MAGHKVALRRYRALQDERPKMFKGDGPIDVSLHLARIHAGQASAAREGLATIVKMTFAEFEDAISSGRITDSSTMTAWLKYRLLRR